MGVTALPWALKPVTGLVSDYFPYPGYCKRPYMAAAGVTGVAALPNPRNARRD